MYTQVAAKTTPLLEKCKKISGNIKEFFQCFFFFIGHQKMQREIECSEQ